jgi:hypothetical protein
LQRREARLRWYAPYPGQSRRTIVRTFPNERNALIIVNTKQLSYGNFPKAAQSYMHKNNLFPIDIDKREHSSAALYIYSMNKLSTLLLPLNKCCNNVVVVSVIIIAFPNFVLTGGGGGGGGDFAKHFRETITLVETLYRNCLSQRKIQIILDEEIIQGPPPASDGFVLSVDMGAAQPCSRPMSISTGNRLYIFYARTSPDKGSLLETSRCTSRLSGCREICHKVLCCKVQKNGRTGGLVSYKLKLTTI